MASFAAKSCVDGWEKSGPLHELHQTLCVVISGLSICAQMPIDDFAQKNCAEGQVGRHSDRDSGGRRWTRAKVWWKRACRKKKTTGSGSRLS